MLLHYFQFGKKIVHLKQDINTTSRSFHKDMASITNTKGSSTSKSSSQPNASIKKRKLTSTACGTEIYWDQAAKDYDREIVDNLDQSINHCSSSGKTSPLVDAIQAASNSNITACDFGCGPGRHITLLADNFKDVIGIDISNALLKLARKETKMTKDTLSLFHMDLGIKTMTNAQAKKIRNIQSVQPRFGLCTNVLIMPQKKLWSNILTNITKVLASNSTCVFLVPSLESALFCQDRLQRWDAEAAKTDGITTSNKKSASNILNGIINRDGVPHKHFLKETFYDVLRCHGFEPKSASKVEYDWNSEFDPKELVHAPIEITRGPYPWDWLVVTTVN